MASDYEKIERPYGGHLEREAENLIPTQEDGGAFGVSGTAEDTAGTTSPTGGGNVQEPTVTNEASMEDLWIKNTIRSINWKPKKMGFYMDGATGYAEFSNVYIVGGITATTGSIGGWIIGTDEIYKGNVHIQSTAERILMGSATGFGVGTGIFMGLDGGAYKLRVGDPAAAYMQWDGSLLSLQGGVVTSLGQGTDLSILGWQSDIVFSAASQTQVNWAAGTLRFHNGVNYSISAGNTGSMAALTYIYLDTAASSTVLQTTTTAATASGRNKVIVAVAYNNPETGKDAILQVFGGAGGMTPFIGADNIAANSITANEIVANTITAAELSTNLIYAGAITLDTNGHIKGGQTAYDTGSGFFLGWSTAAYKFSLGNSAGNKLLWDGTNLELTGEINATSGMIGGFTISSDALTGGLIQTASTGERVSMSGEDNALIFRNDNKIIGAVSPDFDSGGSYEGVTIGARYEKTDFDPATLISWWGWDDFNTPADGSDSMSSGNTLTDVGNPARRNAKTTLDGGDMVKALDLNGTTQYMMTPHASATDFRFTGSFSYGTWLILDTLPSSGNFITLLSKNQTTTNQRSYLFTLHNNGGTYELRLILSGNGTATETESVTWTPSTATWYLVGVTYDAAGSVKFYVNGAQQGATQTTSVTSLFDCTADFAIGATEINGTPASFVDGGMDETFIASGVMPDSAWTSLYNSGDGRVYAAAVGNYMAGFSYQLRRSDNLPRIRLFAYYPFGGFQPLSGGSDNISTAGGVLNFDLDVDPTDSDDGALIASGTRFFWGSSFLPDNDTSRNLGSAALSWNNIYSNNALNVSDERKKKDVRVFRGGLAKIKSLETKKFKRKGRRPEDEKDEIGLMAQQVEQVFPEMVERVPITNKKGEVVDYTYAINHTMLLNTLVSAVKELTEEVEGLKEELRNK